MPSAESTSTDDGSSGLPQVRGPSTSFPLGRFTSRPAAVAWRIGIPLALIVLVLLAFMPALGAGFVGWDDDDLLITNTEYRGFTADSIGWMSTTLYAGHFQPLTWLSYALDYAIWNGHPLGYHLTNVLLHILTALSFYWTARLLLAIATNTQGGTKSKSLVLSAAFAAAVFAAHPLRVESVAWIAERRDVLGGFLYVAAVGCYLRYAGVPRGAGDLAGVSLDATSWRRPFYVAAVLLGLFSLLAKAAAITLPFVLLVLDVYPLRRLRPPGGSGRASGGRLLIEKIPFLILAAGAGAIALIAQARSEALYTLAGHDLFSRFAQATYGVVFYVWKSILPTGLGPLYNIPPREVLLGGMLWWSLLVVAALVVAAVWLRRRWPAIPAALVAYVIILTPVLGFTQSGPQLVADRYSYLACMSFAVLGGAWLIRAMDRGSWWSRLPGTQGRLLLGLVVAALIAVLEQATFRQADYWQSPRRLWFRGVQVSPNSAVAHTNYADALANEASLEAHEFAALHYQKALELDPDDPVALHHYGDILRRFGETDAAIEHYLRALQLKPNRARACYSLAELFVGADRADLAVKVLRDGARRNPKKLYLIDYLARLLASHPDEQIRNGAEALEWAEHLSRVYNDTHVPSLMTLATALAEVGRYDEAVEMTELAMALADEQQSDQYLHRLRVRLDLFREGRAYHEGP